MGPGLLDKVDIVEGNLLVDIIEVKDDVVEEQDSTAVHSAVSSAEKDARSCLI